MNNGLQKISLLICLILTFLNINYSSANEIEVAPLINLNEIAPSYDDLDEDLIGLDIPVEVGENNKFYDSNKNSAHIGVLDKVTAEVSSIEILSGEEVLIHDLKIINKSCLENIGATIFGYKVNNPNRFGVIEFDKKKRVLSIEEKPKNPKSNWAATGLYIFNNDVVNRTKKLRKSSRGELEITDLNNTYLNEEKLNVVTLDENYYWLDTGTHESLLEASNIAKKIQDKYGKESIGLM